MKRRALVTGANRGIGFATAHGLAKLGHDVLVAGRDLDAVEAAAAKIGGTPLLLDVSDPESVAQLAQRLDGVDILVNNAGVLGSGGVLDCIKEWERSMSVMVEGPFRLMHHFVPGMIDRRYGRVVNVSSGWGAFSDGIGGPGAYGVTKAALNALTVSAARGLRGNVKINTMCPGWVRTRMGGMGANKSPEEGADTAIWLATLGSDGPSGGFFRNRRQIDW